MIKLFLVLGALIIMLIIISSFSAGAYTIAVIIEEAIYRKIRRWRERNMDRTKRFLRLWPFQNMKLSYLEKYEWRRFHYANVIHDSTGEILEIQRFESWFWCRIELMEPR